MNFQKKSGFTLLEVVIIVVIVSVGIATVIKGLNSGNMYLQRSREKIIAINLAREGIEQIINIRDSNWKKNAGSKDENRLKTNPMNNSINTWLSSGIYITQTQMTGGQEYFFASGILIDYNPNSGLNNNNLQFSLCQNNTGRYACPGIKGNSVEGYFFRRVRGLGLFLKNSTTDGGTLINCPNSTTSTCGDTSAKEYRFCVNVDYIGQNKGSVELCGILTNFKD